MHWGVEYQREPPSVQQDLASWLADAGVDIILGSHPHVIQPTKWIESGREKGTFVVYSMGNFISNQRTETLDNPYTEDGVILQFRFSKNRENIWAAEHQSSMRRSYETMMAQMEEDDRQFKISH
ncbi:CapA family protein [Paenibacillus sp. DLE-14]|uniref:CapA family protein n=1 Tax=Paenibacillus lignilyticus TaxID=1172615 RepID=A0ABS5CAN1_9BACL|nr:CapA family protein [Paenibacillus lignilyticus]